MTQSSVTRPSTLLRRALKADALVSGAMALLLETGLFLIGYAALVGWLGTRRALPKALVLIVIAGNALWTLGSVALLLSGMVAPNALGVAFVLIQATAVGIFAELQFIGLKRSDAAVAA